jgi:hypothetical protein
MVTAVHILACHDMAGQRGHRLTEWGCALVTVIAP